LLQFMQHIPNRQVFVSGMKIFINCIKNYCHGRF
jgi:hypothetical protein